VVALTEDSVDEDNVAVLVPVVVELLEVVIVEVCVEVPVLVDLVLELVSVVLVTHVEMLHVSSHSCA
jgi:hypothetical protein